MITGEAGVGKTSFVKSLARNIFYDNKIENNYIFESNIGNLISGTSLRGEFELKFINLITKLDAYENIIIFIDEAHVINDTKSEGGISLIDLVKPFILNSNLKFILSTTDIESPILLKDSAFSRRFYKINLPKLSNENKLIAIKEHFNFLKNHHGLDIEFKSINLDLDKDLHEIINDIDFQIAKERIGYD